MKKIFEWIKEILETIRNMFADIKFWIFAFICTYIFLIIMIIEVGNKDIYINELETKVEKVEEMEKDIDYLSKLEWENWDELWYMIELYINGELIVEN